MADIPLPDIVRQIGLQWHLDRSAASATLDRAMEALGIRPARSWLGARSLAGEQYRLVIDWLNEHGLR
jgi:hypothetical protein